MRSIPVVVLLVIAGCNRTSDVVVPEIVGAAGVTITRVAVYQGPEIVLAEGDDAVSPSLPIIAGRDALLRVFYETDGREGDAVTGRLDLANGRGQDVAFTLGAGSTDDDLGSTLDFTIPGEDVGDGIDYRVSILEEGVDDDLGAIHPDSGFEEHPTQPEAVFKLTLVPYRYDADGSGRLPDTSPDAIAALEDRFRQLYPISDVEITVHDPIPWSAEISPYGQGWQEVGFSIYQLRQTEGAAKDAYYYAMFSPTASLDTFCAAGCLLGVTLLNDTPPETGDPTLRLALGVGFSEVAADTMLHELGHAQGRAHVDCGDGVDPNSVDQSYPHDPETIGVRSYDLVGGALVDPDDYADLMSYCYPAWISDYTYAAIWRRMLGVQNEGSSRAAHRRAEPGQLLLVDGAGGASWASEGPVDLPRGVGEPVAVEVQGAGGARQVQGELIRYDHLPGGWLVVPVVDDVDAVGFVVDGLAHRVAR